MGSFLLLTLVDQQITFSYLLQYQPRREGRLLQPPPRLRPRKCVPVGTRVPSGHAHRTHVCMQFGSALGYAVCIPAQAGRGSPQPLVPVSTLQGAALFQPRVGSGARGAAISLGLSAEELGSSPGCERGAARGAGGHPGRGATPPGRRAVRQAVPRAGATPPAPPSGTAGGWNPVAAPRPPAPRCARCGVRRRGRCARAADPARQPGRAPPSPPALPGGGCGSGAGEPGELRVTGAPRAVAEDGNGRGRGRECGVKVPVSRSRLPRGARARCRVSARSGLSLPRFETFRRRPSPRHAPATAALAVPGSGQAFASRRPDPFSGRGRSEAASAGERAGKGAGSPPQGASPGAALRLRTRGSASAAGSPRRAAPGPAPRRRQPPAPREALRTDGLHIGGQQKAALRLKWRRREKMCLQRSTGEGPEDRACCRRLAAHGLGRGNRRHGSSWGIR